MTLSKYLEREGLSLTGFAAMIGVTKGRLCQLKKAAGDWPPDLALTAEEKSNGELDAAELSTIIARSRRAAA